ncbi:7357_t:CDS:2, partial [Ambispora leptoticha]
SIRLVGYFTRIMVEKTDNRICETLEVGEDYGSVRTRGQSNKTALLSENSNDNSVRRNIASLDVLCQSALPEIYNTSSTCISCKGSGTLSRQDCGDGTKCTIPPSDNKSHILGTKREDFEVHVRGVNSFRTSDNGVVEIPEINTSIKSENNKDIIVEFKSCPNRRTIENLQASFGKLFRIGTLGGTTWTTEIQKEPCHYVLAHPGSGTKDDQESLTQVSKYEDQNGALCDNKLLVVDTFENDSDRRNLASFIGCELPSDSGDPKGLQLYMMWAAKFGFNHIIIIGEIDYGMIFLDCYGRVFLWEDMCQMLWPMGNSLEEARLNDGKDNLYWILLNDEVICEIEVPPECA